MSKDKYKQSVYFWGLLGALFGIIDGIIIDIIYYNQLNSFFLKLAFIIFSLNFHAIIGVIIGFIFGFFSNLFKSEKLKAILMKAFLFLFIVGYLGFYINIFLMNFNQPIVSAFLPWRFKKINNQILNITDELILLPLALLATFLLCRFYKKTSYYIQFKWKHSASILVGAVLVNVIIWFTLGQDQKTKRDNSSNIHLESALKQVENDFSVPPDFTPPKNLLIIVIDTLRADHLGCYGYSRNTSPFIDQLSTKGVLFENAIAQRPITSASIASLFTGLYVHEHGVTECWTELPSEHVTLAESYLKHGYMTQSIVKNPNVHSTFNFSQGFMDSILTFRKIPEKAGKWLEQNGEKPFFLYLHFMSPHIPYKPSKEFDVFTPDLKNSPIIDYSDIFEQALLKNHNELDYYISKYDGEVFRSDYLVSKVIKKLEQLDLLKNTLIILTADHGEALGDHGYYFNHGTFPYDACARVPLIIYYENGHFPAKRIQQTVELIDIYPTVHELMDIPYNKNKISGKSFLPLLMGKKQQHKKAFIEAGKVILDDKTYSTFYAIRDDRWKLIYSPWLPDTHQFFSFDFMANLYRKIKLVFSASLFPQRDKYELYDLKEDPQETKNIYQPDSQIALLLIEELNKKISDVTKKFVPHVAKDTLDQDTKNSLKSLGYLN